jgi:DNA invertase Pin-like site-specific DNA recombinase
LPSSSARSCWRARRRGIAKAKAEGKYRGRVPTARRQEGEIRRLAAEGVPRVEIARRLGVSGRSVYAILAAPSEP